MSGGSEVAALAGSGHSRLKRRPTADTAGAVGPRKHFHARCVQSRPKVRAHHAALRQQELRQLMPERTTHRDMSLRHAYPSPVIIRSW